MDKEKKNKVIFIILIIILLGVVLFSYIKTAKDINNSNSSYKKVNYKIDNIKVENKNIDLTKEIEVEDNTLKYTVPLLNENDFYEFTFEITNIDEHDIMLIDVYKNSFTKEQNEIIDYKVTYNDHTEIKENDLVKKGEKVKIRVLVKCKKDIVDTETIENRNFKLELSLNYQLASNTAHKVTYKKLEPKLGDYIKMTSSSSTFSVDNSKTGYTGEQKPINPKQLDLWRVIKINEDKTVDIASVNCSNEQIFFGGQIGYLNYIGYLNQLSKKYRNDEYTINSRIIGYKNQTENITNTSGFTIESPWNYSTNNNDNEKLGGGDISYEEDLNLVKDVFGNLLCKNSDGLGASYWVASRYFYYRNKNVFYWNFRYIDKYGNEDFDNLYYVANRKFNSRNDSSSLRPILTLKNDISGILGEGTQESPYILN